jgi:SulP family sulfate permease
VPDITLLDLGGLLNLDTTGLEALENLDTLLARQGGCLILARLSGQPGSLIQRSGFAAHLGPNRLIANLDQAPAIIRTHLQSKEPAPSP